MNGVPVSRPSVRSRGWRTAAISVTWLGAGIGFVILAVTLADAIARDGGRAYDFGSYWLAGRHLLDGEPLYAVVEINDPGAYRYLPTFAVLMAPVALLPELVVTWAYRVLCLLCLRYLVGSWRAAGWSLLAPPVVIELVALNLTLPLAAAAAWALRRPATGGAGIAPAASLKYGAVLLAPFLWLRRPASRRSMAVGSAAVALAIGLHVLIDPSTWRAFLAALAQQAGSANDAPYVGDQLLFLVPSTLGDFVLRLVLAGGLTALAIRRNWGWLAFAAATLAVPTLWLARLAPLVAVPRLWWEERQRAPAA